MALLHNNATNADPDDFNPEELEKQISDPEENPIEKARQMAKHFNQEPDAPVSISEKTQNTIIMKAADIYSQYMGPSESTFNKKQFLEIIDGLKEGLNRLNGGG